MSGRTLRYILIGGLVLAIGIPSVAMGFGEGRALILGKRNPSGHRTLTKETQIIGNVSTYATRQSNKKVGDGGGAIYGCRSDVGPRALHPARGTCASGRAFQFETAGKEGGRIKTGDTTGAPFTTNATGVATGLNADRVDGKDGTDIANAGRLPVRRASTPTARWPPAARRRPARRDRRRARRPTGSRSAATCRKCTYTATPRATRPTTPSPSQAGSDPRTCASTPTPRGNTGARSS